MKNDITQLAKLLIKIESIVYRIFQIDMLVPL